MVPEPTTHDGKLLRNNNNNSAKDFDKFSRTFSFITALLDAMTEPSLLMASKPPTAMDTILQELRRKLWAWELAELAKLL